MVADRPSIILIYPRIGFWLWTVANNKETEYYLVSVFGIVVSKCKAKMTANYKDKREFDRAPIHVMVFVVSPKPSRHFFSKNLSSGGLFISTDEPIEEETKLELEIKLPSITAPVRTVGEVVWKQRQQPKGFAVKFLDMSNMAQHIIRWEVNRFLSKRKDSE